MSPSSTRLAATTLAIATLAAIALTTSSPVGASGAQRMPVSCYAQFIDGVPNTQSLDVRVVSAKWPTYWDTVLPSGAVAGASGYAVLTPSGQFNAHCDVPAGRLDSIDGTTQWPVGNYTIHVNCLTVISDNPWGYYATEYSGHGMLRIENTGQAVVGGGYGSTIGNATITCNATYRSTYPGATP